MQPSAQRVRPAIRRLRIRGFRGISLLDWQPDPTLNLLVGPADSCKSTLLEALALLLTPAPSITLSEFDYFRRQSAKGFEIEGVIAIDPTATFRDDDLPHPLLQGWLKDKLTELPDEDGSEPVIVCRLTGNHDFEARWEIVGAGGDTRERLSRGLRERLGLFRLWVGDRGERDLRLVQGGALDRFLNGRAVRQSVIQAVMQTKVNDGLGSEPAKALADLGAEFRDRSLPNPVRLGLVGIPGVSLAASVGLTVGESDETSLPLIAWGSGTRRLAALGLAGFGQSQNAIATVDEPETGLEPYRQRAFISALCGDQKRQSFITTHSPAVISAALLSAGTLWRINSVIHDEDEEGATQPSEGEDGECASQHSSHVLSPLRSGESYQLAQTQSEAIVARVPIVCEGCTEVGFTTRLFESRFGNTYQNLGVFLLDAGGHYKSVPICQELIKLGYDVGAVVDDEGKKSGAWAAIASNAALLRWENGLCLERAVLSALRDDQLCEVPEWIETIRGRRAVHQLSAIKALLGIDDDLSATQSLARVGRERFLEALCTAACPKPDGNKKPKGWFKTFEGGYLLAEKLLATSPRPKLLDEIGSFLTKIEKLVLT